MSKRSWNRGLRWFGGTFALVGTVGILAMVLPSAGRSDGLSNEIQDLPRAKVRRSDLSLTLRTGGRVESGNHTLIECEIERLRERTIGGGRLTTDGYATIIWVIPDGTPVREGDLLCELDSSAYEEFVRQQQLELDDAVIDLEQARLDRDKAEVELREYKDGLRVQQYKDYEGQIALAEADLQRQKDRVEWAEKMLPLGYISEARYEQEKLLLLRYQLALDRVRDAYESYQKYTEPKMIQTLETKLDKAETNLMFSEMEVKDEQRTLDRYKQQVENCTIRAPHDGLVIYAQDDDDEPIRAGGLARRNMDLFYLPDLSRMEVHAILDQTVVREVQKGMKAKIRVEAYPGQSYEGTIRKVESLPHQDRYSWLKPDVKEYVAYIDVEGQTEGLLPGMNAEIEILRGVKSDTLVIPSHAMTVEDGQDICYVVGSNGLERRPVTIGGSTIDTLEVVGGLKEGEEVILNPFRLELADLPVVDPPVRLAENTEVPSSS